MPNKLDCCYCGFSCCLIISMYLYSGFIEIDLWWLIKYIPGISGLGIIYLATRNLPHSV